MQAPMVWSDTAARQVIDALPLDERLVLPALQAVQAAFGHVPAEAVPVVASTLNVSVADVHGVLTFYDDLRTAPPAPVHLSLCVAEACQAVGARELVAHVESTVAPLGQRTADGVVEVGEVYCLGNCALGPAGMLAHTRLLGRLDAAAVDRILAAERAAAPAQVVSA